MHLQALLWVLHPQDHLWDQFYPVERQMIGHRSISSSIFLKLSSRISITYNFSFGSFESLWSFFSSVTLETSDETHTAIH